MKKLLNAGFSLVETMLGVGLLGAVAVMGMQVSKMSSSNKSMQDSTIFAQALVSQIENYLENVTACSMTFDTVNANSTTTIPDIKDKTGVPIFIPGNSYDGVTIDSLTLVPPQANNGTYLIAAAGLGFVDLNAVVARKKESAGTDLITKKVRIWIQTDAAGVIQKCSSVAMSLDNLWRRSYWDASKITYQGGHVGAGGLIGGSTRSLVVTNGRLQAATSSGGKITLEAPGGSPSFKIIAESNLPIVFSNNVTAQKADIEMRALKLHSEMKASPLSDTCVSGLRGSIRYNPTLNKNQVCAQVETDYPPTPVGPPICVAYEVPETVVRATYTPSVPLPPQQPNTPYQRTNSNNVSAAYIWRGGTCTATRVFAGATYNLTVMTSGYKCSNSTTNSNPNPFGNRYCKRCIYEGPSTITRDYTQPDPPDEPGQVVLNTVSYLGIDWNKTSEALINATGPCRQWEPDYGPAGSAAFKWVSMP